MAYFNLGDYDGARKAFRQAAKVAKDERSEDMAGQWLQYVASEEDRQRELKLRTRLSLNDRDLS